MKSTSNKIFYKTSGYASTRNFLSLPVEAYTYQKKYDIFKIFDHFHYKLFGVNLFFRNSHWELFPSKGIWHFFNGISFGKTPWVVTFETSLPRWQTNNSKLIKHGVQAIAGGSCKRLIAMSECTKAFQIRSMNKNFPAYRDQIASKISVIHPPQKILIDSYSDKPLNDESIVLTLIGADFFRKGGKEILEVFDKFLQKNAPIKLNIISSLQFGDYASQTTIKDLKYAEKIIKKYPESIVHYDHLPNKRVLEILKQSHIGLLPTYADTYGYSALEAQAAGCPVISTNIRALPEINNNEQGWIIEVPKDEWGDGKLDTPEERANFSKIIETELTKIIENILSNPEEIKQKGNHSLENIQKNHSPKDAAKKLKTIYDDILKDY